MQRALLVFKLALSEIADDMRDASLRLAGELRRLLAPRNLSRVSDANDAGFLGIIWFLSEEGRRKNSLAAQCIRRKDEYCFLKTEKF